MFRPVARAAVRTASSSSTLAARRIPARRWASTAADKPRSWKSGILRWGLAGAIVYYYNTSNVFAEVAQDQYAHQAPPAPSETEALPTLDSYAKKPKPTVESTQASETPIAVEGDVVAAPSGGAGDLEAEAAQQGAFNEETGEINWDCPCLGGMAHGPCGEEFRAAFSCFVYSTEEPKGVDCIEKFKGMQDCFRAHPDIYGAELEDDDEEGQPLADGEGEGVPALARDAPPEAAGNADAALAPVDPAIESSAVADQSTKAAPANVAQADSKKAEVKNKATTSESETLVPKAAHDATDAAPGEKSKA